jgi:hypothetical protein
MARIYHVLPAPSQSFISLPSEAGCQTYAEWGNCTTSRGGLYRIPDASRSFHYGTYQYKKLVPLGMNVTGSYVWGQVGLQDSNSKYQVTGEYSSPDLWLGSMGINPIASSSNDPPSAVGGTAAPTFFESQMSPTEIAGRSWSYTAGAVNSEDSNPSSICHG